ncbi:MAG: hypothetical protein DI565_05480 [Ancylobacter novellus]|uniref:Uncharacterized protein n=1 Tax=Ancylobacter novellus TaxID=921 RepID=A0A2W5KQJ1_ANCNO|nr:MAG: hypothetical protein DI565_05480 [Ancylobacter novellus]
MKQGETSEVAVESAIGRAPATILRQKDRERRRSAGWATLWMAILADAGATVLVTANALRPLRVQAGSQAKSMRP